MGEALLTVKNLNAWYNVDSEKTLSQLLIPCTLKRAKSRYSNEKMILSDFSFALAAHEVAGLIGLNGAGKTTFLKVLSGLLPTFRSEGIFQFHTLQNLLSILYNLFHKYLNYSICLLFF